KTRIMEPGHSGRRSPSPQLAAPRSRSSTGTIGGHDREATADQAANMATTPSDWSQELIEHQHGVIARWQLRGRAPDLSAADSMLRSGRWQWLYRGVYGAYTGKPSRTSILWAAVRRCGPEAVLSHFTAAELDRIIDEPSEAIHVSISETARIRF